MQKIFKRVAILLALMLSIVCLGVCLSACDGDDDVTGYAITVTYPDGTAVNGLKDGYNDLVPEEHKDVEVQICVVLANGTVGNCFSTEKLDANGKATLAVPSYKLQEGEKFKLQINYAPQGYTYDTVYVTEPEAVTIALKQA